MTDRVKNQKGGSPQKYKQQPKGAQSMSVRLNEVTFSSRSASEAAAPRRRCANPTPPSSEDEQHDVLPVRRNLGDYLQNTDTESSAATGDEYDDENEPTAFASCGQPSQRPASPPSPKTRIPRKDPSPSQRARVEGEAVQCLQQLNESLDELRGMIPRQDQRPSDQRPSSPHDNLTDVCAKVDFLAEVVLHHDRVLKNRGNASLLATPAKISGDTAAEKETTISKRDVLQSIMRKVDDISRVLDTSASRGRQTQTQTQPQPQHRKAHRAVDPTATPASARLDVSNSCKRDCAVSQDSSIHGQLHVPLADSPCRTPHAESAKGSTAHRSEALDFVVESLRRVSERMEEQQHLINTILKEQPSMSQHVSEQRGKRTADASDCHSSRNRTIQTPKWCASDFGQATLPTAAAQSLPTAGRECAGSYKGDIDITCRSLFVDEHPVNSQMLLAHRHDLTPYHDSAPFETPDTVPTKLERLDNENRSLKRQLEWALQTKEEMRRRLVEATRDVSPPPRSALISA